MIQIDDAGSGSLVGGTCIGVMRVETNEYHYDIIPLECYTKDNFSNKLYLKKATEIAIKYLNMMNVGKREEICVCRGYMFDCLRDYLKTNGYNYKSTKILNPLQDKIEKTFEDYALSLGLSKRFLSYTKYPFHFHRLLKWVYADYYNRYKLCKTGWKSFIKYGSLEIDESYSELKKNKNLYCLKCGNKIDIGPVKIIKFKSNYLNVIYLHVNC
ncbi:hypothetical protein Q2T46_00835 [Thermoanaerobacterium sp. CMT5567-10]|uniref:hypothetical protein n=1 Tax=Thermoanaerobacterium sp. CMT5567-10 TaxID=3061989 RepID=UPI0026DEB386|nr:hypothetical protein [Thermoanaerobacterium sp. CMT5567-10]WKV09038.1 hypothetical protein Q2T46_00835 [Thermoanaerobacterium sp. CMT5567-10]